MDIEKQRLQAIAMKNMGWPATRLCSKLIISRMTFYRWWNAYQTNGKEGLIKKSTRPKTIHYKVPDKAKRKIIEIIKPLCNHGLKSMV